MEINDDKDERLILASDAEDDEEYESIIKDNNKQKKKKNEDNKPAWKVVLEYVRVIAIGALIAFLLCKFVIINAVVPTRSMVPTINVQDRLIGLRIPYYFSDPKRGDIVIFKAPEATGEGGTLYIKRIIGLPGETIEIVDGIAYKYDENGIRTCIDKDEWHKSETPNSFHDTNGKITLGEDQYFVMGDNRNNSSDSRVWGTVDRKLILAKAWLKYYKGFSFF